MHGARYKCERGNKSLMKLLDDDIIINQLFIAKRNRIYIKTW